MPRAETARQAWLPMVSEALCLLPGSEIMMTVLLIVGVLALIALTAWIAVSE